MLEIVKAPANVSKRKSKPKTNRQVVAHMMNYSNAGGLKEAFILTAIDKYSREILASEPWSETALINFESWKLCATEIQEALEKHYANQ
mgnify:FL=1